MAGFIYAIEGSEFVTVGKIEKAGLMQIFADVIPSFSQRHTSAGPGGGDKMLICIGDDTKQLYYKPAEQTWQRSLNERYWLGIINNNKPTEVELRRKKRLAGHYVELGDEGNYLVPVARIIGLGSALPQTIILGKNGEVMTEELPLYAQFSSRAEKLWEDFQIENKWKEGKLQLTIPERINFAIEAVGWNYHIGIEESNLLKLITTTNLTEIMSAIIDVPTIIKVAKEMEAEKKKEIAKTAGG